jgi:hypothetical protein
VSRTVVGAALPVVRSDNGPIVGWRCWFVMPDELLLRPLVRRTFPWKPREAARAVCPEHRHDAPADRCECPGAMVVGQAALWGHVVEHERGWRGSRGYPRHLYVLSDDAALAEGLRVRYLVPVEFGPAAERLRALLPGPRTLDAVLCELAHAEHWPESLRARIAEMFSAIREGAPAPTWARAAWCARNVADAASRTAAGRFPTYWLLRGFRAADAGDALAATRALWVRFALWQRARALGVCERLRDGRARLEAERADVVRGTTGRRGSRRPYRSVTLTAKRARIGDLERRIAADGDALAMPTYREWRLIVESAKEAALRARGSSRPGANVVGPRDADAERGA